MSTDNKSVFCYTRILFIKRNLLQEMLLSWGLRTIVTDLARHEKFVNRIKLFGLIGSNPLQDPPDNAKETANVRQRTIFSLGTDRVDDDKANTKTIHLPDGNTKVIKQSFWHDVYIYNDKLQRYTMTNLTKGCSVVVYGRLEYTFKKSRDGESTIKYYSITGEKIDLISRPSLPQNIVDAMHRSELFTVESNNRTYGQEGV